MKRYVTHGRDFSHPSLSIMATILSVTDIFFIYTMYRFKKIETIIFSRRQYKSDRANRSVLMTMDLQRDFSLNLVLCNKYSMYIESIQSETFSVFFRNKAVVEPPARTEFLVQVTIESNSRKKT